MLYSLLVYINVKLANTVVLSLVFVLPYIYPSFLKVNITTSLIRYIPMSLVLCMYILSSSESVFFLNSNNIVGLFNYCCNCVATCTK